MTALLLLACTAPDDTGSPAGEDWTLTWSDEFDGDGAVDPEKWVHDLGGDGWGNQQIEYNTDRVENARQSDGFLVITAIEEEYRGNTWTSARLKTQGLFAQTNGRFEARIQLPQGVGIWPAFWMLGEDIESVGWPACGEIDILEARGADPYTVNAAIHGPGHSGGSAVYDSLTQDEDLQSTAHVYAVEWDQDHIAWFFDDTLVMTAHPGKTNGSWVFDDDFFLILNVAVGGTYGGPPDDTTPSESRMFVDYVRVYERNR